MGRLVDDKNGKTIQLSDERQLGYIERGSNSQGTIFYMHGWPSSRLELLMCEPFTSFSGPRIISIDRPGVGLSDYKRKRRIPDLADDISELADYLDIDTFSVLGYSGGAPYAHACACRLPDRVNSVGIVSGLGPYDLVKKHLSGSERIIRSLGRKMPKIMEMYLSSAYEKPLKSEDQEKAREQMLLELVHNLPAQDKRAIEQQDVFDILWKQMQEAFINGTKGVTTDGSLLIKDWGFKLSDITEEVNVFLWHGTMDTNVQIGIGKAVEDKITHCTAKYFEEEGHYSLLLTKYDEIASTLTKM